MNTPIIISKISLCTLKEQISLEIHDSTQINYNQWGGYNDIIFSSNQNNLYISYEPKSKQSLKICLIDPNNLQTLKTWQTNSHSKIIYGSIFMIQETLYCTNSYCKSPTTICYKYNTNLSKDEIIEIPFENRGGYETSLHFCYLTNQL